MKCTYIRYSGWRNGILTRGGRERRGARGAKEDLASIKYNTLYMSLARGAKEHLASMHGAKRKYIIEEYSLV